MAEVREYHEVAGGGLPCFVVGQLIDINGQMVVVTRVIRQLHNPDRATLEVEVP